MRAATTYLRERLQAPLGDAYVTDRELPGGAMSPLFLATERWLDRRVVIKVLPRELTSDVSAARFSEAHDLPAPLTARASASVALRNAPSHSDPH